MLPSQALLLLLLAGFAGYLLRLRSLARVRLAYLALALLGGVLILRPEMTSRLSAMLGIGRGADLMFYFFIIFALFHFASTAASLRQLERDVTTLTRSLALAGAREPGDRRASAAEPR